jgi:ATP-dependent RNA helicase DHX37/DHR1
MPRFVPRQRKHKLRKRAVSENEDLDVDTNQIQILPLSKEEKDAKRRQLKGQLQAGQPNASSKKQKRLDKYIENKLKKDENLDLLQRLSQAKVDTSQLQSSKQLGKRKHAQFATDAETWKSDDTHAREWRDNSESSDLESVDSFEIQRAQPLNARNGNGHQSQNKPPESAIAKGSGLKKPLALGEDGLPMFYTKIKSARRKREDEESWEGFNTELTIESFTPSDRKDVQRQLSAEDPDETTHEHLAEDYGASSTESSRSEYESNEEDDHPGHWPKILPRTSAFKSWATQQINTSLGHVPFKTTDYTGASKSATAPRKPTVPKPAPDDATREDKRKDGHSRRAYNVPVARSTEMEESRPKLPVVAEEQKIMEAIHSSPCIIIWGATGSGKTTQVPQFLFEAGYGSPDGPTPGLIGITQPRRVAAVSMAKRVGQELGQHIEKVSYQIRFETTTSKDTAIKFMTDGILLREISQDFALLKYSIIIIDEAHERSVNTDILIGMLSRIVDLRSRMSSDDSSIKPLKLVIMSATLRFSDFLQSANLFPTRVPPLVQVEGRQFPVTTHFARHTERDYLEEAYRKISRGHRKLPPGGLLIFLTGQNEIKFLLRRLQDTFQSSNRPAGGSMKVQFSANEAPLEIDDLELGAAQQTQTEDEDSDVEFVGHDGEAEDIGFDIGEPAANLSLVHILPLYSQLPTNEQFRVFEPPPQGSRLIVLATNVAETSLTIPGIRYVFDCGRSKERTYDPATGVQRFEVGWISKASAEQRAGRAGRTGPGHCYRLYSSAVYERDFAEHGEPEILRTPVESVVLQMKTMGIDNVFNFPFPTPPDRNSLTKAERLLKNLGALTPGSQVTPLGHSLSIYPLSPRYGKMLAIGSQHGCLHYVIALVSGLAVGDMFVPESHLDLSQKDLQEDGVYTNEDRLVDTVREQRRKEYNKARAIFSNQDPTSDVLKLLSAVCAYAYADDEEAFCKEMFLRSRALKEISQLRKQLTDIVRANHPQSIGPHIARLPPPIPKQVKALNQIVASGFTDQVAIRADLSPTPPILSRGRPKRAIDVPYLAMSSTRTSPSSTSAAASEDQAIYLHPSSILARLSPKELPQYLIYSHLQQSAPSIITSDKNQQQQQQEEEDRRGTNPKIHMLPLTAIGGAQLSALAHGTALLRYGKPIGKVSLLSSGGGKMPERRECWIVPFLKDGDRNGSRIGWPLPARKVVQRRDTRAGVGVGDGDGWVIERFLS